METNALVFPSLSTLPTPAHNTVQICSNNRQLKRPTRKTYFQIIRFTNFILNLYGIYLQKEATKVEAAMYKGHLASA